MMVDEAGAFDRVDYDPGIYSHPRLTSKQVLVGLVRVSSGITRTELALASAISKSATAQFVAELIETNLVAEVSETPAGRQVTRRSAVLRPVLPDVYVAGVHLAHGAIVTGIADMNGDTIATSREPVDMLAPPEATLARAADQLTALIDRQAPAGTDLGAIVTAIPGPIDRRTGAIKSPSVLSAWSGINPAEQLSTRLGLPVHVDNDANLGAWGELERGAARRFRNAIYLEVSRGVGAGLIIDGRVYTGEAGIAGEIGHTQVDPAGPLCRCGQNGCLEVVVASGPILERLRRVHDNDPTRTLDSYTDEVSARILREAGHTLGRVVAEASNILNPQAVIVGGELSSAHPAYLEGMREAMRRYVQPVVAQGLEVVPADLGDDAVLRGCFVRGAHSVFAREKELEAQGRSLPRRAEGGLICTRPPAILAG